MDYCATISTSASPARAAQIITQDLEQWWSTRIERTQTGFTTRFNNSHATFKCDTDDAAHALRWTCTDAHMIMEDVEDATEWVGTTLLWRIDPTENGCTIELTHKGLTPTLPCYDICRRGWEHFFETSLRDLLNGQKGAPNTT